MKQFDDPKDLTLHNCIILNNGSKLGSPVVLHNYVHLYMDIGKYVDYSVHLLT
jgi:hypothetical protein